MIYPRLPPMIHITLVFSPRAREVVEYVVSVSTHCTAAQLVEAHHLTVTGGVSVWGKRVAPNYVLCDGDRIELCRPLTVDPKVARRERFAKQGAKKKAGLFVKRRLM